MTVPNMQKNSSLGKNDSWDHWIVKNHLFAGKDPQALKTIKQVRNEENW